VGDLHYTNPTRRTAAILPTPNYNLPFIGCHRHKCEKERGIPNVWYFCHSSHSTAAASIIASSISKAVRLLDVVITPSRLIRGSIMQMTVRYTTRLESSKVKQSLITYLSYTYTFFYF